MWQDLSPFLSGSGPVAVVQPSFILSSLGGGNVEVTWSFSGPALSLLGGITFTATLYADPFGPGPQIPVGAANPTFTPNPISGLLVDYTANIAIPSAALPPNDYSFTVVITAVETTGLTLPIAGFVDVPFVDVGP